MHPYRKDTLYSGSEGDRRAAGLNFLKALPIIPVHGSIGLYPDIPYGFGLDDGEDPPPTDWKWDHCVDGLSITGDSSVEKDVVYTMAKDMLDHASSVYLLGIGYHRRSLTDLGLLAPVPGRNIFATLFKEKRRLPEIRKMFDGQEVSWGNTNETIFQFLEPMWERGALVS